MIKKTRILKVLLSLAVLFIASQNILAQDVNQDRQKKTPEERAKLHTEKMTKNLELTNDQASQVYDIMFSQATQVDALRNNKDITKESRKEQMKSIFQVSDSKLQGIFSKEQTEKWNKWKEKKKEKHMTKKKGKKHNKQGKKNKDVK